MRRVILAVLSPSTPTFFLFFGPLMSFFIFIGVYVFLNSNWFKIQIFVWLEFFFF